jgi:hypothetical protein
LVQIATDVHGRAVLTAYAAETKFGWLVFVGFQSRRHTR